MAVLVVAAGSATRFGGDTPKQYLRLRGRTILNRALDRPNADIVQAVISADHQPLYDERIFSRDNLLPPVHGGRDRQQSVLFGLRALADLQQPPEIVLIHDAARPDMPEAVFERVAKLADQYGGAYAALPSTDSLHQVDESGQVTDPLPRDQVSRAQTPQGFRLTEILAAHEAAANQSMTDDVAVARAHGMEVMAVEGSSEGEKITFADDLPQANKSRLAPITAIRTGVGYDVHAFDEGAIEGSGDGDEDDDGEDGNGNGVMLGGLLIPHDRKLKGHSDADVLLHTITDALLGALGDGDIGEHFPPSDPQWKGAASDQFLIHAVKLATDAGWSIEHVDSSTICEAPKLSKHKPALRQSIANIMSMELERVSVKATTSERLGFTGRGEGIAAAATVTLVQRQAAS